MVEIKKPQLSDLRESGSIEQDADIVMFLYRPEYYNITEDEQGMPTTGVGQIIIAKHRNGSLENVNLKFIGKFTKFTDLDFGGSGNQGMSSFSQGATGSDFDTITLPSKANGDSTPPPDDMPEEGPVPF